MDVDFRVVGRLENELLEVAEVGILVKLHLHDVVHVLFELDRTAVTQFRVRNSIFHPADLCLAVSAFLRRHELPRQTSCEQTNDDVTESDKIIASRELMTLVRIGRDVPACADKTLPGAKRDVFARVRVDDRASQTKVDQVDRVRSWTKTQHYIVRLDVAMNRALVVHVLHALKQLEEDHARRHEREFATAKVKQVLEARTQKLTDQVDELVF